jgi:isoquinoline 1-oxidoreductase beta subunit
MVAHLIRQAAESAGPVAARISNVSRRGFMAGGGSALGIVIALQFVHGRSQAATLKTWPTGASDMPNGVVNDPKVFIALDPDGTVTIVAHRSEMGTGSRTSLPMIVADELEADWSKVKIVQAPGDEPRYGNQDTDGSRSTRHFIQPMRQAGAAMRTMLEQAAAQKWGVSPDLCRAKNHEVVQLKRDGGAESEAGPRIGFGDLAVAASALPVPDVAGLRYKDDGEFRYIGKGKTPITDLRNITMGKATYGADVRLPGMRVAMIERPPVVGGKVKRFDASAALKVPGVVAVEQLEGAGLGSKFAPLGGVAVVAENTWAAIQGRQKLIIEWDDGPNASYDTAAFKDEMLATSRQPGEVARNRGDAEAALKAADKTIVAEYYQPHMAHATMEPPAALVSVSNGKAEVWAPVQSPYGTREDVAAALGLKLEDVTVHVTLLGGGFGRKSKCDYVLEAAILSKKVGAPVRVQWTREDDLQHGFYHTTSVERIEAGLDKSGKVTAWRHRSVAPSIMSTFMPDKGYQAGWELAMGLTDLPFDIPNIRAEQGKAMAHARVGWFRSVSNVERAFAVQSFVAELAAAQGRDPKEVLLELIGPARVIDPKAEGLPQKLWNYGEPYAEFPIDTGRLRNVVELAAAKAGWGAKLPQGEGMGIAVHRSFVTYVATAVRVAVGKDGRITVPQVDTAIDCGFCVNPERVRSQMEGASVMGLSLALYDAITFEKGRVTQSNFNDYELARITNYPRVNTHIVEHPSTVHPTGVGEPGVPPFAPALANAIFAATGKRLRSLPFGETIA